MPLPCTLTVEWWSCLWNSLLKLLTHLSFTREIKPLSTSPADMAPCLLPRLLQPPATPINIDALLAKYILAHFLSRRILSLLRPAALQHQSCAHQYPSLCAFYAKPSFGLIIPDCSSHSDLPSGVIHRASFILTALSLLPVTVTPVSVAALKPELISPISNADE